MNQATYIKTLGGFNGEARLYRLDPPMQIKNWDWDGETEGEAAHVVVSACDVMFCGPETYIFPADESGRVTGWGELEGSFRGGLDHERALQGAGYAVGAAA